MSRALADLKRKKLLTRVAPHTYECSPEALAYARKAPRQPVACRHLRFGELPTAAQHRLEQADGDTLLRWSEGVLTAASLDEVLGG